MLKRTLALLLAALMLVPFAGCGTKPPADTTPTDTTPADTTPADTSDTSSEEVTTADQFAWNQLTDSVETKDFGGADIMIATGTNVGIGAITAFEQNSDRVNDAQYEARSRVETRFNVKFGHLEHNGSNVGLKEAVQNAVAVGDNTISVSVGMCGDMSPLMTSGYLLNLANVEQFDFSREWYWGGNKQFQFGEKQYLVSSMLTWIGLADTHVMVCNKNLVNTIEGLEIPYELIFNGGWTLDAMTEFSKNLLVDVNGDGDYTKTDIYGLVVGQTFSYMFQTAVGVNFISRDEENFPVFYNDQETAVRFMDKWSYILGLESTFSIDSTATDLFSEGTAMLLGVTVDRVRRHIMPKTDGYAILPNPKLDETQENYIFSYYDFPWAIPTSASGEIECIASAIEALQCQNYNLVVPEYFETTMKVRMAESPNDTKIMDMIPRNMVMCFENMLGGSLDKLATLCKNSTADTVVSTVKKYEKSAGKQLTNMKKQLLALDD